MASEVRQALSEAVIKRLADENTFQRGADYFSHGHVESLEETAGQVRATVRGKQNYTVVLTGEDGMLDYSCDCPASGGGIFCKHCVAVSLACLKPARRKAKAVKLADAAKVLRDADKEVLIRMLLEWAKDDKQLRERLVLFAAGSLGPDTRAQAVGQAFKKAVAIRGFKSYRDSASWAREVDRAIDGIEQLLADGQPAAVIELCESALKSLDSAIRFVDDSDGYFSGLSERLANLHYHACQEARPDSEKLAKRLFDFEFRSEYDLFSDAAETYAEILGAKGLDIYRQLAEAEWAKVPQQTAKSGRPWGEHFRITKMMESLARASGNLEELVAVMSRDLSSGYEYLQIAELYREHGQPDNALIWAEKGVAAFPKSIDGRLLEFAAEEYHRRGRHDDAMKLIWTIFLGQPMLTNYQLLEKHAKQAKVWPEYRERALSEIRVRVSKEKEQAASQRRRSWSWYAGDHSQLVEIFLHEGRADDAWREAQTGDCSNDLWLRLAVERGKEQPQEAAAVYMRIAEAWIAAVTNGRYEEAVELLLRASKSMERAGRGAEFMRDLQALRFKYGNKRNFLRLLAENQLLGAAR